MSAYGILFLAGLALAPFTAGVSLLIPLAMIVQAAIATKPRTPTDEEMEQTRVKAWARYTEGERQRSAEGERQLREQVKQGRAERSRQQRFIDSLNPEPPAYAWYQCSGAMCRHKERLLTCHGDTQECDNCGRSTYRM